jgi:hypothetical protein
MGSGEQLIDPLGVALLIVNVAEALELELLPSPL